ncbi:hypothetical protein CMO93_02855 [Candidatus Woesearchaeota archaeon]|nr:hypothetical protein [Candidatus Woesearchaeota archaeon]|tara:strand:- start:3648 stop:4298 length:651 start_codon:yes stop_codon:yes gene_type:complete
MVIFERGNEGDLCREIPIFSVKYTDVFHLRNLYVMMHEMLLEEGWLGFEGQETGLTGHTDLETLYSENAYQRGIHRGGKELWVWWRARKHHEGRTNMYFLNTLDIDWHAAYLQDREIVHQGKKMKVDFAQLEVFFKARIISDVGHSWENHKLLRHLKGVYEGRIQHANIEKREKELWREVYRLQSKVKAYLNFRTWAPTAELFHPKTYGWEESQQI